MSQWERPLVFGVGFVALVLVATCSCALLRPDDPWLQMLLPLAWTAIAAAFSWLLVRRLAAFERREQAIMGVVSDVAMGDLTKRIDVSREHGLVLSVNEMIYGLASLVDQLRSAAAQLSRSTTDIQSAASQQAAGAGEQAAVITEITAASEELALSAKQIAEHAKTVVEAARRASQSSRDGGAAIQSAAQGIKEIREASHRTARTIGGLNERSQKIGSIMDIIKDIAAQTKLLSLNAAIEAARAGEAGRGFAVVATQVRNLANNATESTKQIQELLVEIQRSAEICVAATEEDANRVDEGTALVASVGDALGKIGETIDHTMQVADQIGVSTRQQQSTCEQVAEAMREIVDVAKHTAEASSETDRATSELLELANSMEATVGSIKTEVS